ncbi:hypothetical protein Tco_1561066 [Tanacetum coccineum]
MFGKKGSVEDLFGILCEEIRAKMVSITVKQTAKVLRAERMNMGVREMVGPQRFRVMPLMDVSFPYREVTRLLSLVMPLLDALNFNHCDGKLQCLNCTDIMECSDSISFIQCLVFAADMDFGDIDFVTAFPNQILRLPDSSKMQEIFKWEVVKGLIKKVTINDIVI